MVASVYPFNVVPVIRSSITADVLGTIGRTRLEEDASEGRDNSKGVTQVRTLLLLVAVCFAALFGAFVGVLLG